MLRPHARIAVIAPSSAYDPLRLEAGLVVLRGWGYRPELLPGTNARFRYLAGDDVTRARDLNQALSQDGWDAVWMVRGGYGLARLLPLVEWERVRPIPVFGFSDGTALLNPLSERGGLAVHAPVLTSLGDVVDAESLERLRCLLAGEPQAPWSGVVVRGGSASGRLVGGNLCVLASLAGTPWRLRAKGRIVVLEDVGEAAYKVDRLVRQLVDAGSLDGAAGFALGSFLDHKIPAEAGYSVLDVLHDALAPLGVPVLAGLPVGHGPTNHAFVFADARIEGDQLHFEAPERGGSSGGGSSGGGSYVRG